MKINQIIINETSAGATGSGSVATVSSPLGKTMSRNSSIYGDKKVGSLFKGKKTSKPYANSLNEGRMGELDYDLKNMKPAEFQKKYGMTRQEMLSKFRQDPKPKSQQVPVSEERLEEEDKIIAVGKGKKLKPGLLSKPENSMNPTDTVKIDVPLLIRLLEYAREDASNDMDLHDLAEKLVSRGSRGKTLTMKDYEYVVDESVSPGGVIAGGMAGESVNEGAYEEGYSDGMNDREDPRSSSKYGPQIDDYRRGFKDGLKRRKEDQEKREKEHQDKIEPYLDIPTDELKQRLEAAEERTLEIRDIYNKLRGSSSDTYGSNRNKPKNDEELKDEFKKLRTEIEAIHSVLDTRHREERNKKDMSEGQANPNDYLKVGKWVKFGMWNKPQEHKTGRIMKIGDGIVTVLIDGGPETGRIVNLNLGNKSLSIRPATEPDKGLASVRNESKEQVDEKAVSKKQQRFMGMVHAAQKGEKPASKEVAKVAKTIKKSDAKDFASTKHKGLPEKVKKD